MLARRIVDDVESGVGALAGLGLLDLEIEFGDPKVLRRSAGRGAAPNPATAGIPVHGYEIHHGRVTRNGDRPWLELADRTPEGSVHGAIWGTHLHGLLESDAFRRAWLGAVATRAARPDFVVADDVSVAEVRSAQLDLLADLIEKHLDLGQLESLLTGGPPPGLGHLTVNR
jgi:adenosylcobyric acid synthase